MPRISAIATPPSSVSTEAACEGLRELGLEMPVAHCSPRARRPDRAIVEAVETRGQIGGPECRIWPLASPASTNAGPARGPSHALEPRPPPRPALLLHSHPRRRFLPPLDEPGPLRVAALAGAGS